jgi:hypothetical protein
MAIIPAAPVAVMTPSLSPARAPKRSRERMAKDISRLFLTRIIPARLAIDSNPNIKPEDILPEEDVHALLRMKGSQEVIAVSHCDCRVRAHKCDKPVDNCFEFGKYAEFNLTQSSTLKVITVEESIAISDEAERAGLLKSGGIRKENGGVLCHCCSCCCNVMGAAIRNGVAHLLRNPSRYRARTDSESALAARRFSNVVSSRYSIMRSPLRERKAVSMKKRHGLRPLRYRLPAVSLIFDLVRPPEFLAVDHEEQKPFSGGGEPPVWARFASAP